MRGIVWDGKKLHVTDELEVREPGPGEVGVRVTASGICHSDLYLIDYQSDHLPIVPGHEAAGVIELLGPGVANHYIGERVTVGCQTPCGECADCRKGNLSACPESWTSSKTPFTWRGRSTYSMANSSSFAQRIIVKASQVYNADGIPDQEAALIGCAVSTGVGAVRNLAKVQQGDVVVVIGIGGVGVNAIQGARMAGASRIIAVDLFPKKLDTASSYGATDSVLVTRSDRADDISNRVFAVCPRVDIVIECSGAPTAMEAATLLPYIGGRTVFIGLPPPDTYVRFNASSFVWGRSFVAGLNGGTTAGAGFQRLVDDVRNGSVKIASQISHVWPLDRVEEAIDALRAGQVTRAVLDMS